ncbi:MAG: hypothetical protein SVS85_00135 [Candidatus Nanohaloarchaea archaeon]|nr:hypothetical protein [Candidatus Nanohaloarchaea archaeon]
MNPDTSLPDWLDEIVSIEYGEELSREQRASVGEYFWNKGSELDDFDTFYAQVVREWPEEVLTTDHRAHSIENYWKQEPWNCLGRTTFLTALADLGFGKDVDIVLEYTGDWDAEQEMVRQNRSHVYLIGQDGTQYGPDSTYDADDEFYGVSNHGPEILPPLYRLSEAYITWRNGDHETAMAMADKVEERSPASVYIDRKVEEVRKFGY